MRYARFHYVKIPGVSQLAVGISRVLQSKFRHCLRVTPVKESLSHMQSLNHLFASTSITVPMSLLRRRHGSWRLLPSAQSSLEEKLTLSRHAQHFQGSLGHATSTGEPIIVLQNVTAITCLGTFKSYILAQDTTFAVSRISASSTPIISMSRWYVGSQRDSSEVLSAAQDLR